MDSNTLYILAWLDDIGEPGWRPVQHGDTLVITLQKDGECIEYHRKHSGGTPAWFCVECPDRLAELIPPPFKPVRP